MYISLSDWAYDRRGNIVTPVNKYMIHYCYYIQTTLILQYYMRTLFGNESKKKLGSRAFYLSLVNWPIRIPEHFPCLVHDFLSTSCTYPCVCGRILIRSLPSPSHRLSFSRPSISLLSLKRKTIHISSQSLSSFHIHHPIYQSLTYTIIPYIIKMLVAASLALALVPALAYAQVTTATVQVTDGAQTTLIQTNLPQQFETRTIIFTAPVNQISSLAQAIPTSIQVVVSQPDGGFIPINLNGFSTSVFVPAAASVPTGVPLSPITPIFVPAPISTALSAASQSVASRKPATLIVSQLPRLMPRLISNDLQ